MGGKAERFFLPVAIGFAPFILLALTWAPEGRTLFQVLMLRFYLPIVAVELFVIAIAFREGMVAAMRQWTWSRIPSIALAVLLAAAIGTAIAAPNPGAARLWTAFWLIHLLFGFSVAHLAAKGAAPRDVIASYLAGFVAFVAGCFLFATQVRNPAFDWTHDWPAITHIRHFGYYAAAMMALGIGVSAGERPPLSRILLFLIGTVGFTFALWTGSRGAVIAVACALFAGVLVIPALRRPLVWGSTLLALVIGGLVASQLPAHGPWMGFGRTITQTVGSEDVSSGRTQIWINAVGAIRERPIFGYGENQMATVAPFHGLGQTHNVVLQVLLAWGLVGLICVAVLGFWFLIRTMAIVRREPDVVGPPFLAMVALASLAAFDGSLFHVVPLSIFAACAGMIASRWPTREVAGVAPQRTTDHPAEAGSA